MRSLFVARVPTKVTQKFISYVPRNRRHTHARESQSILGWIFWFSPYAVSNWKYLQWAYVKSACEREIERENCIIGRATRWSGNPNRMFWHLRHSPFIHSFSLRCVRVILLCVRAQQSHATQYKLCHCVAGFRCVSDVDGQHQMSVDGLAVNWVRSN